MLLAMRIAAITGAAAGLAAFGYFSPSFRPQEQLLVIWVLAPLSLGYFVAIRVAHHQGSAWVALTACTSWGAAHEYTMQSLTPKGGQMSKYCPIRLPKGTKVDVINDDDDGYAVVTHRGKTWWVDGERVR